MLEAFLGCLVIFIVCSWLRVGDYSAGWLSMELLCMVTWLGTSVLVSL